jgi:uncharacterized protein
MAPSRAASSGPYSAAEAGCSQRPGCKAARGRPSEACCDVRRSERQGAPTPQRGRFQLPALIGLALMLVAAGPVGPEVNPPLRTGSLTIAGRTTLTVEMARTPVEKMRGLSGRVALTRGHGMVFVYETPQPISIWMKDMRFSLDILWIRDGRIVHIEKQAPPLRPGGPEQIYTATGDLVLEVPAGFADRENVHVGDPVVAKLP